MEDKIYLIKVDYISYNEFCDEASYPLTKEKFYKAMSKSKEDAIDLVERKLATLMTGKGYQIVHIVVITDWTLKDYIIMSEQLNAAEFVVDDKR